MTRVRVRLRGLERRRQSLLTSHAGSVTIRFRATASAEDDPDPAEYRYQSPWQDLSLHKPVCAAGTGGMAEER